MNPFIKIKGNSNYKIIVNDNLVLEKISEDEHNWNRLLKSIDKQVSFTNNKYIFVPKIYQYLHEEKTIKMEYIKNGSNIIDLFLNSNKKDITFFCKNIFEFIENNIQESEMKYIECKIFIEKIDQINNLMLKNKVLNLQDIAKMEMIFYRIKSKLSILRSLYLPIGPNHGDLTFSNMIFQKNKLFLFDFLDSFIESPINDIIKLLQDSLFDWSINLFYKECDITKIKIVNRYTHDLSDMFFNKYEWYSKYKNILLLINFLRIIPYVKEESTKDHVIYTCIYLNSLI